MPDPHSHTARAEQLAEAGRLDEAEAAYAAALASDPLFPRAVLGMAHLLLWQRRPDPAVEVLRPLASLPDAPIQAIEMQTRALVGAGLLDEALIYSNRAAAAGVPHAALGSAQIAANLGRFADAEARFRAVLAADPGDERARRGLARAVFAGPGGLEGALAATDAGLAHRWTPALAAFKANLLTQSGRASDALSVLQDAMGQQPGSAELQATAASAAALTGQPDLALGYAEAANKIAPADQGIALALAEARLGAGDIKGALRLIEILRHAQPLDQKRIALQATAWRLLGDPRAAALYDYERFVRAYTIAPPPGWATLGDFLADLKSTLHAIHDGQGATLDQSVRGGTQTNVDLTKTRDPVLRALFGALEAPITEHIAAIGRSGDPLAQPLSSRNTGAFAFAGAWSVRLKPGAGHHVNHTHPQGWLSSAFYVDLPEIMDGASEQGWIQFGEPGLLTRPPLGPEHKIRPEPGRLVLFPSYMWHGTTPFAGDQTRLTFAFDVVPTAPR